MTGGVLNEAYERFHRTGPEWGEDRLTNHGPMAAEVLVRRGHEEAVDRWVDAYIRRLDELPPTTGEITDSDWASALGDGRRVGDWTAYFIRQLAEQPWRQVLATWWARLLPGIAAGTTHGVIRTGHVVRALLAGAECPPTLDELAHALAFWAARAQSTPAAAAPAGRRDPLAALDSLPRIPDQQGTVSARFGQLAGLADWPASVAGLRPAATPDDVPARLADLVSAATLRYLTHGHGQPVLLVHTATAPNAVLHTLPALPSGLWAPSLTAVWAATAAIFSSYAPVRGAPRSALPAPPASRDATAELVDRAVAHADEHVIKFTDTAAEVYTRTGQTGALAAALRAGSLIPPSRLKGGDMEQLVSASLPSRGSFGALLRAGRHRANLSQEQLAARAELSERTVRELEAGRVRSPRSDTVRLLADALQLSGPERDSWMAAAWESPRRCGPAGPAAGGTARSSPGLVVGFIVVAPRGWPGPEPAGWSLGGSDDLPACWAEVIRVLIMGKPRADQFPRPAGS